ncbi:MAG: CHASE2 domain-containing protein [Gemmatimonadaceae bacterium]|nr:CHASE2 domain-containing protein [Gemmatimonadaceae bacterium]
MTQKQPNRITAGYLSILLLSLLLATATGWTSLASRMNGEAYDWMFRIQPPTPIPATSIVLAIDEQTLSRSHGMSHLRETIAKGLQAIAPAQPKAIAVDVILADEQTEAQDAHLEQAFQQSPLLILAADMIPGEHRWEYPLPRFRQHAEAIGHIHAAPDPVSRVLPLEHAGGKDRRWAMALEAFRARKGAAILESPDALEVAGTTIPSRRDTARARPAERARPRRRDAATTRPHQDPTCGRRTTAVRAMRSFPRRTRTPAPRRAGGRPARVSE